jgi:hypothetical protein
MSQKIYSWNHKYKIINYEYQYVSSEVSMSFQFLSISPMQLFTEHIYVIR